MASTTSASTPSLAQFSPLDSKFPRKSYSSTQIYCLNRSSSSGAYDNSHHMVDQNLIILRKRIHEMKIIERNYEPPADWMDWEKKYYTSYDTYICEAMGLLQSLLMNTRPSLAFVVIALVVLSVSTSTALVISQFFDIVNASLNEIHRHM